ncbi:MAG: PDZ domain-containing protein [Myxococcales bacterium]|nr:PDZ domain-containing protein [Myxococcales bacterium]
MRRVFRPLAVFSIASGVSLAVALQLLVGGARGHDGPGDYGASAFFPGYDLAKLDLVDPTLYYVSESYVDQSRLDWDEMFIAALDAVEHEVPVCMFSREPGGNLLDVEIGEYRTVLEVPPIEHRQDLQKELRRVAELLTEHLEPTDLPHAEDHPEPMAKIEYTLINGMLSTLDPHSVLLPPEDAKEMDVENQGEFGGLGITISVDSDRGRLIIDYPIKDTPATRAGLQADDHIVRIDGESTVNMSLDDAVRRLRGPVGKPVVIEVMRPDHFEPLEFRLERELISLHPVKSELVGGSDIGYVSIVGFHEKVEQKLHEELHKLRRNAGAGGLAGLILDLRGNPGGFLNQAVKVADTFLEKGQIVSTVDGDGRETDSDPARPTAEPGYPIVVLVDSNSASASEIVAGALRFNGRAVIIGERTFGKGSVQNLHPFADNSKLKLTISKYLTPGSRSIQASGIPADIELVPSKVPAPLKSKPHQAIRLFERERVRREADLERALERGSYTPEDPAYRLRYVERAAQRQKSDDLDLEDPQVLLARDVLLAARGMSRRADVLAAAGPVIQTYRKRADVELVKLFANHGIDWADGVSPRPSELQVEVNLDLGEDGQLVAGEIEDIAVEVTNKSDRPLYRVAAVLTESDVLGGREFFFGRIDPGQTRRFEQPVRLPVGWATEHSSVAVDLRDRGGASMGTWQRPVRVKGVSGPALSWQWAVHDDQGNGDGILQEGERLSVNLELYNTGPGPTAAPFARLVNHSGKALDLVAANLEPGELMQATPGGGECASADTPGCRRVIAPGERWTGAFEVDVRQLPEEGELSLELSIGDAEAYDHGTVVRGGFYDWFTQHDTIELQPGMALPASHRRQPPKVEITRAPQPAASGSHVTLSGVVTDDAGVTHVMVFAGDDKVFFEGSGPTSSLRSLPFTADVALEPGTNVITVLATDSDGFVASDSVLVWLDEGGVAALSDPQPGG